MRNSNDVGVYQTEDGFWGYRFKVLVNGKYIEKKRLTDDAGNKFKNKTSAIKARKRALQLAEESANAVEAPPKPARKTVKDILKNTAKKGVLTELITPSRNKTAFGRIICWRHLVIAILMKSPLPRLWII